MGEKPQNTKDFRKSLVLTCLITGIIIVIIVLLFSALNGRQSSSGAYPAAIKTESLTCTSANISYTKLKKSADDRSNVTIIGVFGNPGGLVKLSLDYVLTYDSPASATADESWLLAAFAKQLAADGLSFSEFNNKLTIHQSEATLSLFANPDDLSAKTAQYFLLGEPATDSELPTAMSEYKAAYERQGFKCKTTSSK